MSISNILTTGTISKPWADMSVNNIFADEIECDKLTVNGSTTGAIESGRNILTVTPSAGISNIFVEDIRFTKINNIVEFTLYYEADFLNGVESIFTVNDLPVAKTSNFSTNDTCIGTGVVSPNTLEVGTVLGINGTKTISVKNGILSDITGRYRANFTASYTTD